MNQTKEKTVKKENAVKYGGKAAKIAQAKATGKIKNSFADQTTSTETKLTLEKKATPPTEKPVKKSALAVVDKPLFLEAFSKFIAEMGVELSPKACEQMADYYEILVETNRVMNLTGIVEPVEVAEKHMADSLRILPYINDNSIKTPAKIIIDVGTGAGLPGIPLAIALPDVKVILLDSQKKRCDFLERTCKTLGLTNTQVVWGRAEEIAHKEDFREKSHFAVARAVAPMPILLEYLSPFVAPNGRIIAMKGSNVAEEIAESKSAAKELNAEPLEVKEYTLVTGEKRSLAVWKKINLVKKKYPRNSGQIKKKPL